MPGDPLDFKIDMGKPGVLILNFEFI